jgi:hypothetical protein
VRYLVSIAPEPARNNEIDRSGDIIPLLLTGADGVQSIVSGVRRSGDA